MISPFQSKVGQVVSFFFTLSLSMLDIFGVTGLLIAMINKGSLPSRVTQLPNGCEMTSVSLVRMVSLLQMLPLLQQALGQYHYWRKTSKVGLPLNNCNPGSINMGKKITMIVVDKDNNSKGANKSYFADVEHHLW